MNGWIKSEKKQKYGGIMSDQTKSMRRNYFINKEFQGRYIFTYFILVLIGSLLVVGVFSLFSSNTISIVHDKQHIHLGLTPGVLFKNILSTQWLLLVAGGGCVVLVTLFLTHRIAGPFSRFEKTLAQMKEGDISRNITLRKKDEGKELAQGINAFNGMLSDNLSLIEAFNSKISISARQIKKELKAADTEVSRIEQYLDQISDSQKKIRETVSRYTLFRRNS
jgi:methyl-accepting chemotaxis protein